MNSQSRLPELTKQQTQKSLKDFLENSPYVQQLRQQGDIPQEYLTEYGEISGSVMLLKPKIQRNSSQSTIRESKDNSLFLPYSNNASTSDLGAVLGQRLDGHFQKQMSQARSFIRLSSMSNISKPIQIPQNFYSLQKMQTTTSLAKGYSFPTAKLPRSQLQKLKQDYSMESHHQVGLPHAKIKTRPRNLFNNQIPRDQVSYFKNIAIFLKHRQEEQQQRRMDVFMTLFGQLEKNVVQKPLQFKVDPTSGTTHSEIMSKSVSLHKNIKTLKKQQENELEKLQMQRFS